ncbi:MAG: ATP-dependent DNA helicase RecG [Crocinitomicaceae bacterium TMED114]|nr:MAG: ATP-dependent DNA helicase RecG [Crocinitomicaceae bacterium TMED114]
MPEPLNASTPIEFLKGIGPKRAEALAEDLGIRTCGDLLFHLPFRYEDRTGFHRVSQAVPGPVQLQFRGTIRNIKEVQQKRGRRLEAEFVDEHGDTLSLVWFKGVQWVARNLPVGQPCVLWGRVSEYKGGVNMAHPEVLTMQEARSASALHPVYSSTERLGRFGLNSNGLAKAVQRLIGHLRKVHGEDWIPETLPPGILAMRGMPALAVALDHVHQPADVQAERLGRFRLKFEEFLFLQLLLVQHRNAQTQDLPGVAFTQVGDAFNRFYGERIPFELTGAQKRVIREIREDTRHGRHMNRLLQGDVGSGKTMVALLTALLAVDNGCQACIMAPTEILAQQHLASFRDMLGDLPIRVELLTGSVKTADRKPILEGLADGTVHLLVGTHAVLEPKVVFHRLGLVVIDEQHRFGVAQRARLWAKADIPPHVLVMTATPIPRTLSMTVYGDLDLSVIDELPPGRKPIRTVHRTDAQRLGVFGFMRDQIAEGRQVYVVYPLIEESAQLDHKDLMDGYESLTRHFPPTEYRISVVHGRMKPEDKDMEMQRFAQGVTQIMVATTVIEVGVNVPNASVMVIESATRFGLSQLHQLRGRVGRGANQSFCILMSDKELGKEARRRLETMVRTQDGFEIAEVDLELRGPGDLMGTQQSGVLDLKVADLIKDRVLLEDARDIARRILNEDPGLDGAGHALLKAGVERLRAERPDWSRIS